VLDQFLADPTKVGMIGLLAIAITAFMRGWIVTGAERDRAVAELRTVYEARLADKNERLAETVKDKNEFKDMLLKAADTADRALVVAQKSAGS
jgi:hypothetical protein